MAVLTPAQSIKLGPRIIPFFRTIISQSMAILRGPNSGLLFCQYIFIVD
jgi:hypothetical protein